MSNKIKAKLTTIDTKLDDIKKAVLAGKRQIAYALKFNGIETVNPYDDASTVYDTFTRYAELIRRLKSANAMTLEFRIPDTATTKYKRTVVLPLYFGNGGVTGVSVNSIAKEIIASDTSTASTQSLDPENDIAALSEDFIEGETSQSTDPFKEHTIIDTYGNECIDPNWVPSLEDIERYLTSEQQEEMLDAMEQIGIVYEQDNSGITDELLNQPTTMPDTDNNGNDGSNGEEDEGGISSMDLDDDFLIDEQAENDNSDAVYNYTVDWGDGSGECTYTAGGSYTENKAAIWHTYENPGTYDVSINGNFRRIYANPDSFSNLVENGEYIDDVDGSHILNSCNYAMRYHLIAVIAWGNTLLTNMDHAFCYSQALTTIPMYDSTNSFVDVTNFTSLFRNCTSLKELPFNTNTNKGLFSGCAKATTFAYAFYGCTGLTGSIPIKLMDGCPNVTSVAGMFTSAKFSGDIPVGLLAGMTALTNASEMFSNCNLSGELSADLFKDSPNITTIYRLFYGCSNVTGTLKRDFIGGLSKLTDMRQAFYGCKGITGIDADAFYNIKSNNINCRQAFYGCTGITSIPEGLLESMTGTGLMLEKMFDLCTGIASIAKTSLANLKVANARGMFGGCTGITSACPDANSDWNSYDTIKKWYGAFARTKMSDIATVPVELGGDSNRKYPEGEVGKIVLQNGDKVDLKDYVYNASNKPVGIVYADVYLDKTKSIPTLANDTGNVVAKGADNAIHKQFVMTLTENRLQWTSAQNLAEDVDTITNTSTTGVAYNTWDYADDGSQSLHRTRYNGEAYSKALSKFILKKGYATNVLKDTYTSYSVHDSVPATGIPSNIYLVVDPADDNHYMAYTTTVSNLTRNESCDVYLNTLESTRYPAINYCNTYNNGVSKGTCFLPDGADLWDMFTQKEWMQKICDGIKANVTCSSMRNGDWYWASAEGSQGSAWYCHTNYAYVDYANEWSTFWVRPAFAITA